MFFIFILLLGIANIVFAQPNPDTLWTRTYGGGDNDGAVSIQQTTDGGYVVAGYTYSFGAGSYDFYVVKTDGQGNTLWTRTYGGVSSDVAYSIQQTTDGGYVVAGYTESFGAGISDFYAVKTDGQGDTLWTRTYGGVSSDVAYSIQQTTDGGYVVAGYTSSFGAGNNDIYVVKTDGQGDTLWTRTYGGTNGDYAYSIQQTTDGGYVVAGYTSSFGAGNNDFYVVKTDGQGDTLWTRTYGGNGNDYARSIQQTTDGGYVIAGGINSFGAGNYDFYVVKTDGQGDTLWTRTYGGSGSDEAYSIQHTTDGGYVVAGYTSSFGAGISDFYAVKTDGQGDTLWTRTYGGSGSDEAYSIQHTTDGGYVVAGYTDSFGAGFSDFYVVKTGPDVLGTEPNSEVIPSGFALFQNFPNPFNSATTISFNLQHESRILLNVFDLTGRSVAKLADGMFNAGLHQVHFNAGALPSGIYIYRLNSNGISQSRKLLLLK